MTNLRLALCQTKSEVGTRTFDPRPANLETAEKYIRMAASNGANLVIFGEMFLVGYRTDENLFRYALRLEANDPYMRRLAALAKRHRLFLLMGTASYAPGPVEDIYNSALLFGPTGFLGVYHKVHVAAFPYDCGRKLSKERLFYSPGHELPVFETPFGRIGIQICYDIFFPESVRVLALKGAHLVLNIAAAVESFETFWDHVVPVRAAENALWFAVTSVVGDQRDDRFFGGSRVAGPDGVIRRTAKFGDEDCLLCDIDLSQVAETRACSHIFDTRNPRLYAPLTHGLAVS